MLKALKNKRPITYISLAIYLLLSVFIIVESCLSSSVSGGQSHLFASISAWLVNLFKGPQTVEVVQPTELLSINDSSFAGKGSDDIPNIVIGTTTRLIFTIKYPEKKKKDDTYNNKWTYTKDLGNDEHYNLVVASPILKDGNYDYTIRIVANDKGSDVYSINFKFADKIDYVYRFHIVDLIKPSTNQYESKIAKDTININESLKVETKFTDPRNDRDTYIRRYLDESLIERSSSNDGVATIDENGVIHGVSEGNATITYGKYNFPIHVTSTTSALPTSLDVSVDPSGNANPGSLDYDYIFESEEDANDYSVVVKANISDKSVSWSVSDSLCAKIAPYKYDENGYPIYFDDDGTPTVRIAGYRKKGDFNLTCKSNSNPLLFENIPLTVGEATATDIALNVTDNIEIYVNEQIALSIKTVEPKNVPNKKINVIVSDSSVVEIVNNNSESVIIKATKVGSCHVTVKSLSNETLVREFDITTKAKQAINDDNYDDFHSVMRKFLGHFLLFMVTAIFGAIFFITMFEGKKRYTIALPVVTGIGLFIAGLSELIQYFVPSRSGAWSDVGIDFAGYFVGVLVCFLIILIINMVKKRKNQQIDKEQQ